MLRRDAQVHSPCGPTSTCSPEQTCPPTQPKFLIPVLGGCLHPVSLKYRQSGEFNLCQRVSVARRPGMGLGEEKGVLLQGDQGPGFSFSAQAITEHFTLITCAE